MRTDPVPSEAHQGVTVQLAPYVTIGAAAIATGLTEKAIHRKIESGVWLEHREWRRAPDGRLYISVRGYQDWVEGRAR